MQNAKDTFYEVLRERLAAGHPQLTAVLRGVTRPAVMVEENELGENGVLFNCFRLRWTGCSATATGAAALVAQTCEVRYSTEGTATAGGMDRGRMLTTLDAALFAAVSVQPQRTAKRNFAALASGGGAVALASDIWWSGVDFDPAVTQGAVLNRVARLTVWSYREAGEA